MTVRPPLKWVGGKRQLLPELLARVPTNYGTYFEPFVGGGAFFFALNPKSAHLTDSNEELINLYRVIQHRPECLIEELGGGDYPNTPEAFYEIRADQRIAADPILRAARTIYLNKTCFTPGSQVLREDETTSDIETIRVGDRLWNGRIVHEILRQPYTGTVRRIKVQGNPWTMSVTADHPVLSISGPKGRQEQRSARGLRDGMRLVSSGDLRVGDYVCLPTSGTAVEPIDWHSFWPDDSAFGPQAVKTRLSPDAADRDIARLLGYYAAEGSASYQERRPDGTRGNLRGLTWTFGEHERDTHVADLEAICKRLFGKAPAVRKGVGRKYVVELCSVHVATFVTALVPGQSWAEDPLERKTKRLHPSLLTSPVETQIEILTGWYRGDGGCRYRAKQNSTELTGTCTVLPMARQMYRIAQRCGLKPSWHISHPKGSTHHLDGTLVDNATAHVRLSGDDVATLGFPLRPTKRRRPVQRRIIDGYLIVRVREITDLDYDGIVYNVEVDGDHLVCVDGVVSHNCFNGLYRVNKSGGFNAPFGKYKDPKICDESNLREVSKALHNAGLSSDDFRMTERWAEPGDFCYFDPPYAPLTATSNFTAYTAGGFGLQDQIDLRDMALRMKRAGVHVLLSNSSAPLVEELYGADFTLEPIQARRNVNSDGGKRGAIKEYLIR